MTQVHLVPWLLCMSAASWIANWWDGTQTDHPEYLLFLAGAFAIYDCMKIFVIWLWRSA